MEATLKSGDFEGQYQDSNGPRGTIKLSIAVDKKKVNGRCNLVIRDTDEPGIYDGDAEGSFKGNGLRLKMTLRRLILPDDQTQQDETYEEPPVVLESDIIVKDASSFAEQAIYGIVSASPGSGLGGGVFIAWSFKE